MTETPAKVLVVDDEPSIRELVTTVLRYEGFDVASAETGRQALAEVERFRPNLVVLDVMLPDLDGFEVQRRLNEAGRRVPVVFLTARDAVEDRVRGLTIGGDDYLTNHTNREDDHPSVRSMVDGPARRAADHACRWTRNRWAVPSFRVHRSRRLVDGRETVGRSAGSACTSGRAARLRCRGIRAPSQKTGLSRL